MIKHIGKMTEMVVIVQWIIFGLMAYSFFLIPLASSMKSQDAMTILYATAVVPIIFYTAILAGYISKRKWLSARVEALRTYTVAQGLAELNYVSYGVLSPTMIGLSHRDRNMEFCCGDEDLMYGEYSFAIYRKSKYSEYKAATFYYAVCMAALPRELPNLFFDAKATQGKEFRRQFNQSQRHSLEGDFDSYYDTYFPTHYTLDSLSFITPEVMQAIIAAKEYDVEISGSRLYLYGPLRPMPEQITEMRTLADEIRRKLLHNIVTYRDQRLDYADGRTSVSAVGMQLRKNLSSYYFGLVFGSVIAIGSTVLMISLGTALIQGLAIGAALAGYCGYMILEEHARWRALDAQNRTIS